MVIADHLEEIMTQEGSLADDDLRVLFKRIHGIDFQRAEREGFEERRSAIEDLFADAGMASNEWPCGGARTGPDHREHGSEHRANAKRRRPAVTGWRALVAAHQPPGGCLHTRLPQATIP